MPAPGDIGPEQARIIQEILDRELPGHDLVSVELPRVQPAPPATAGRGGEDDVPRSPSLETLQEHYRRIDLGTDQRHLPDLRAPGPGDAQKDPGIVRCRVRPRDTGPGGEEIEVLIAIADRTIIRP
jgi:hypothetical protein